MKYNEPADNGLSAASYTFTASEAAGLPSGGFQTANLIELNTE
ncbi:MAG: hypothetical protein U0930_16300 [Pirellulales bacterium]